MRKEVLLVLLVCLLCGCDALLPKQNKRSEVKALMATYVKLDVCVNGASEEEMAAAYKQVWQRLENIAWRMNVYDEKSDVAKINQSFEHPVFVGEDTYWLLERSKHFHALTNGAFDITVWPLIQLWKQAEKLQKEPTAEEIEQTLTAVGIRHLQLREEQKVMLFNDQAKLDLGGIAKGYAIDEAARIFRKRGFENFHVDAGGDVYVGGLNCEGKPWRIGIRDPRDTSMIIDVLGVSNVAITTSGNYEQYYTIDGKKFSHIINPVTGRPQENVISATVIAPNATDADALATAITVLGPKEGTDLINSLANGHESLIFVQDPSGKIVQTQSNHYQDLSIQ